MHDRFVLITGCSGGGKSSLLEELQARGHLVKEEPGRRIVRRELEHGGTALPWVDPMAFADRALMLAIEDRDSAVTSSGWVFFDRGIIDAASALQRLTGRQVLKPLNDRYPYHRIVFLVPPWREIFEADAERRHGFEEGVEEYERLSTDLPVLGYDVVPLPKTTVAARADFVLSVLEPGEPRFRGT